MPTFIKQTNFTAGELSPRLKGRTDFDKYGNGTETMLNAYAQPHGGVTRRSGTRFIAETKDSTKTSRVVRFEFSSTQAYIIEFGDQYARFYKDQGQILEEATISDVTQANPGVVTSTGHPFDNGDVVTISGVVGMTELNGNSYTVANKTANTFELSGTDTTGYTAYTSDGTAVGNQAYEIATPYVEDSISDLSFAQSADVLFIFHGDYEPRKLIRNDHADWQLNYLYNNRGPYEEEGDTSTDLTPSAATGTVTITATADTFTADDVGRLIAIKHTGVWGEARITAYTSPTSVTASVGYDFNGTGASPVWKLGTWSTTLGWPKLVTFYENRLVAANTDTYPQNIWFSDIGVYARFNVPDPITDDSSVTTTLVANNVNVVRWLSPARLLLAGTNGGEWSLEGDSTTGITPTALRQHRETTHGSYNLQSLNIDELTLYVQRNGRTVREFVYSFESDAFISPDLSILADHLTRSNTIVDWTYAEDPSSIVWMVRDDGVLLGMTYMRDQKIVGWHRHTTDGTFESVATIPGTTHDEVWCIVNRTINGSTKRYIEMFESEFNPEADTDATNGRFIDSKLSYDGTAVSSVSGLSHLEGETVSILADGKVHPSQTVSSGAISLNYSASIIHVGLPYTTDIKTLPIEVDASTGTSTGRTKRITRVSLKLYESVGCKVGRDEDNLDIVPFNEAQIHGEGTVLFSGDKEIDFDMDDDYDGVVFIRQDQPLPLTILSMSTEVEFNAR